jgi:hypothetical protein
MKSIHYDSEGDILTVTFAHADDQPMRGVELNDNIVLYYNRKTKEPIELILVSYQALLKASARQPLQLGGLQVLPVSVRMAVLRMIRRAPVSNFLKLVEARGRQMPASYPAEIFTSNALQAVA